MWKERLIQTLCSPDPEFSELDELFVLKNRDLPRSLFKYRCVTELALRSLSHDNVWLADPTAFNDPYDSAFGVAVECVVRAFGEAVAPEVAAHAAAEQLISTDQVSAFTTGPDCLDRLTQAIASKEGSLSADQVDEFLSVMKRIAARRDAKIVEGIAARLRSSVKVCSFSELNDSILMWSHYADHHRGFCLEYPIHTIPAQDIRRRLLFPVVYSAALLDSTPIFERMAASKPFNNLFPVGACLRKSPAWSYEKEWRLVLPGGILAEATTYAMPTASAIYLGAQASAEDGAKLTAIARQKGIHMFQMSLSRTQFKLEAAHL